LWEIRRHIKRFLGVRGRGGRSPIAHAKTHESNFIHYNFVQFGKQHTRYKAYLLYSTLFCYTSVVLVKYTSALLQWRSRYEAWLYKGDTKKTVIT